MKIEIRNRAIEIRGLTRGEIKELRKRGVSLNEFNSANDEQKEEALDFILSHACIGLDPDSITPGEALELYVKIATLSYAGNEKLKNSESPPASPSADGGSTAGSADPQGSSPSDTARTSKKKNG